MPELNKPKELLFIVLKITALLFLLYSFLLSIELMGASFKLFGKDFADQLMQMTSSPLVGLFVGVLVTSLVQSSSTVTSLVVGMVAVGALSVENAIPVIMGANIGTSVTNSIVSIGSIGRREEFKAAFAAATIHDYFNILAVIILLPIQASFNFLGIISTKVSSLLMGSQGLTFNSPLKMIIKPTVHFVIEFFDKHAVLILIFAFAILMLALKYIVTVLKSLVLNKAESFFDRYIFKTVPRAVFFGIILTVMVQSSSVTTSLVVPLVGAGILNLRQIYPFTIGANIGTTVTAFLASLVTGEISAVTVAFAHFFFNVFGGIIIFSIPFLKNIPIILATTMSSIVYRHRWVAFVYVGVMFFAIPLIT
ncbi:MAG: Na/Pi symporter, partial [Candidatus Marinimicrobia bacterium]|nr:Na/Pi symporter [Candidatus Neomarinimicrobiota bacterium]